MISMASWGGGTVVAGLTWVRPLMACLLVQYAAWSCRANLEAVLDTLTILPPLPRAIILLAHSWERMKGALTFT